MDRACSTHERNEKCIQYFCWEPEGKQPLRRPRHRWKDNIRMYLREVGWEGMGWIYLVQDRYHWQALVNKVMNLWVP